MSARGLSSARLDRLHDVIGRDDERGDVPGIVSPGSRRGACGCDGPKAAWAGDARIGAVAIGRHGSRTKSS